MAYKRTIVNLAILKEDRPDKTRYDFELIPFPAYQSKHHALAIHRSIQRSEDKTSLVEIYNSMWQVSHKASGQHVFTFALLKDAMSFTGALAAAPFDPFDKTTGALLPRIQQAKKLSSHLLDLLVLHHGSR